MKKNIYIIILFTLLSSCWKATSYDNVADENKPKLNNNDTLLFLDSLNNKLDTFHISLSDIYDMTDSYSYSEIIFITYLNINKIRNFEKYSIYQGSKGLSLSLYIYNYDEIDIESEQQNLSRCNMLIQGVLYNNIYALNQYHFETDTLPKTVYYSLKHGIVRYDYADGRKYELVSK